MSVQSRKKEAEHLATLMTALGNAAYEGFRVANRLALATLEDGDYRNMEITQDIQELMDTLNVTIQHELQAIQTKIATVRKTIQKEG